MRFYAYTHTDGRQRCCTLPDSSSLLRAMYVVDGSVVELERLPGRDEMLDANLQIVKRQKRRSKALPVIIAEIAALTAADRTKLFTAVAARVLQEHPAFARALSIAIDGDEAVS